MGGAISERLRLERDFGLLLSFDQNHVPPASCEQPIVIGERGSDSLFPNNNPACRHLQNFYIEMDKDVSGRGYALSFDYCSGCFLLLFLFVYCFCLFAVFVCFCFCCLFVYLLVC